MVLNNDGINISTYDYVSVSSLDIEIPVGYGDYIRIYVNSPQLLEDDIKKLPKAFEEVIDIITKAYR